MMNLLYWYLFMSLILLLAAGWDKLQAKRGGRRLPEKLLLLGAALGGATGLWLGMTWFGHKTKKPLFRYLVPILVLLQWGLLMYWGGVIKCWQ